MNQCELMTDELTSTGVINRFVALLVIDTGHTLIIGQFVAVHFDVSIAAGHICIKTFNNAIKTESETSEMK